MIWTGVLILACIAIHFYDFYFVKLGLVKGEYMAKVENFSKLDEKAMTDEDVNAIIYRAYEEGNIANGGKWIRHITYDERTLLKERAPELDPEPDFYYMAREKFSHWHIVIGYNKAIEVLGSIYTWIICLGFAVVPILVYLGL